MEKWLEEVSLSLNSISPAKSRTDATQPETHELQHVCSRLGLLSCCHQADIRMRSHRLLRLNDDKSAASCQDLSKS